MFASSALHIPAYRRFFFASCFGTMALWMMRFLFGWLVWEKTESFLWVGMASTGLLLPSLIITPISGVISDRINLRTGLLYCLGAQASVSLFTLLIFTQTDPSLAVLLTLTLIFGCAASASAPFRLSLTPRLVGKPLLPNAVGLGAIVFNASRIAAPALAAALLTVTSPVSVLCCCSLAFTASILINSRLPSLEAAEPKADASAWRDFKNGLIFSWQSPYVRLLLFMTLINSQVARALIELLPALSGTFTEGQPSDLAMLTACAGVGSILGGILISRQKGEFQRLIRLLIISLALTCLTLLPMLLSPGRSLLGVLIGGLSLLMTILGTGSQILVQMQAEDAVRGRVMSLFITVAIAGPALGAFLMGAVAEFAGFQPMLIAMMMLSAFSCYWLWQQNHAIRNHQKTNPQPLV